MVNLPEDENKNFPKKEEENISKEENKNLSNRKLTCFDNEERKSNYYKQRWERTQLGKGSN